MDFVAVGQLRQQLRAGETVEVSLDGVLYRAIVEHHDPDGRRLVVWIHGIARGMRLMLHISIRRLEREEGV